MSRQLDSLLSVAMAILHMESPTAHRKNDSSPEV